MRAHLKYQLTPAARTELKKALEEYKEELIRNASRMQGKSSFSQEDIKLSRDKMAISTTLLPESFELGMPDVTRFQSFMLLMVLKLSVLITCIYIVIPNMNTAAVNILLVLAAAMVGVSCYILYRFITARKNIKQKEMLAGTLVWQWSAIEALSSKHLQPEDEDKPKLVAVLHYLHNEFHDTQKSKKLKAILKARNNIVNHHHIEVRKARKLIEEADDIIRYLKNKEQVA